MPLSQFLGLLASRFSARADFLPTDTQAPRRTRLASASGNSSRRQVPIERPYKEKAPFPGPFQTVASRFSWSGERIRTSTPQSRTECSRDTATDAILSARESARCRPALIDAPTSFLCGFPLPEASTAEDALHAVVGLVAGVLEQETVHDSQRHHRRPGFRVRVRVRNGEPVVDRLCVKPREALHHRGLGRRALQAGLAPEVERLDHERVALPPAARVARPSAGACRVDDRQSG